MRARGAEPFVFRSAAHIVEGTAHRIRTLLCDPEFAARLGANGHEDVKSRFLTTSNLRSCLALAQSLLHPGERLIRLP